MIEIKKPVNLVLFIIFIMIITLIQSLTETPFLGPLNEISSSLCNHTTLSGGFSVKETTQLKLTMLPISTNMSGPPITYVEGSGKHNIIFFSLYT